MSGHGSCSKCGAEGIRVSEGHECSPEALAHRAREEAREEALAVRLSTKASVRWEIPEGLDFDFEAGGIFVNVNLSPDDAAILAADILALLAPRSADRKG